MSIHTEDGRLTGVYAVTVGPDISDDPIRWLFTNEIDADTFAEAINKGREFKEACVTFEPIAYSLDERHLALCFPDETKRARKLARETP